MGKNAGRYHSSEKKGFVVSLSHMLSQFAMESASSLSFGCLDFFLWSIVAAANLKSWM